MAITGSVDLGLGVNAITVDADPTTNAVDAPAGSMIIYNGQWYQKTDSGSTTNSAMIGPQGFTGPQGLTGAQGFFGTQGAKGAQGLQGIQGPIGPQGLTGSQGFFGPQGLTGAQGVQGVKGAQGIQGVQGIQGPVGPTVFGNDENYVASDAQSTTTSTTMTTKTTLTTGALTGTYWVHFAADLGNNTAGDTSKYQFMNSTDSVTVSVGSIRFTTATATFQQAVSSIYQVAFTGAAKTFLIQYAAVNGTASIQNARIAIWRAV